MRERVDWRRGDGKVEFLDGCTFLLLVFLLLEVTCHQWQKRKMNPVYDGGTSGSVAAERVGIAEAIIRFVCSHSVDIFSLCFQAGRTNPFE